MLYFIYGRVQRKLCEGLAKGSQQCPTSQSSSECLANFAIATRDGLIASIAKVSHSASTSRSSRGEGLAKDSRHWRCGQIAIVRNGGSRHEANVC